MGLASKIWGALVSTPKLTDDIFDKKDGLLLKAGEFIGGLHYSEQEKSEFNLKLADNVLKHVEATAGENTEKSKTRRKLAIKWIDLQINLIGVTVLCVPLAILFPDPGKEIFKMMIGLTTSWLMVSGTVTVMAYFFGTYGYGTYVKKKER